MADIGEFLNLNDAEMEYFLTLVDFARAHTPKLQKRLRQKLKKLKGEFTNISKRMAFDTQDQSQIFSYYYSSWHWTAVHVLLRIPEFQTTEAIARRLEISIEKVKEILEKLEQLGLAKKEGLHWKRNGEDVNVAKSSPYCTFHLKNWRDFAMTYVQANISDAINFTAVYSLAKKDVEKISESLLNQIEEIDKTVAPSRDEELVCLNIDFFKVGKVISKI